MSKNGKKVAIFELSIFRIFSSKLKKLETEKIVLYDVTCDPIEI